MLDMQTLDEIENRTMAGGRIDDDGLSAIVANFVNNACWGGIRQQNQTTQTGCSGIGCQRHTMIARRDTADLVEPELPGHGHVHGIRAVLIGLCWVHELCLPEDRTYANFRSQLLKREERSLTFTKSCH